VGAAATPALADNPHRGWQGHHVPPGHAKHHYPQAYHYGYPAPVYVYAPPRPVYYAPAPVYYAPPPPSGLTVVIPLHFD
jgi:hypothetical protein